MSVLSVSNQRCLKTVSKNFEDIYTQHKFEDFIFEIGSQKYHCSKVILRAALPEIQLDEIEERFSQIPHNLIEKLLQYFYCWQISVNFDDMKLLLEACCALKLHHLKQKCEEHIIEVIQPENYISWLKFALENDLEKISKYYTKEINDFPNEVINGEEFRRMEFNEVLELIKRQASASYQLHAAIEWCKHFDGDTQDMIETFLAEIDLAKCSPAVLKSVNTEECVWSTNIQNMFLCAALQIVDTVDECGYEQAQEEDQEDEELSNEEDDQGNYEEDDQENYEEDDQENYGEDAEEDEEEVQQQNMVSSVFDQNTLCFDSGLDTSFASLMFERFCALREAREFTEFDALDAKIQAHKIVLAATCPYFSVEEKLIQLDGFSLDGVQAVITYLYSDEVLIPEDICFECIKITHLFDLENLLDTCKAFADQTINPSASTCFPLFQYGKHFEKKDSTRCPIKYITDHFADVCDVEEMKALSIEELQELLNALSWDDIEGRDVFKICIEWIKKDLDQRRQYLDDLLTCRAIAECRYDEEVDLVTMLAEMQLTGKERDLVWAAHAKKSKKTALKLQAAEQEALYEVSKLRQEKQQIQRKKQAVKRNLDTTKHRKQQHKSEKQAALSEISKLRQEKQQIEGEREAALSEIIRLKQQIQYEKEAALIEIIKLRQEKQQTEGERETALWNLEMANQQNQQLQTEKQTALKNLNRANQQNQKLQTEKQAAVNEISKLRQQIEGEKQAASWHINSLFQHNQQLQQQLTLYGPTRMTGQGNI